jgi:arabinose-5-phosphate isomerase
LAAKFDLDTPIKDVMSRDPITASGKQLAAELVVKMKQEKINSILVVEDRSVIGALNMQDLLRAGVL